MKILFKATIIGLALSLTTVYGAGHSHDGHNHSNHGHNYDALKKEIDNTSVKKIAIQEVKRLALEKKISKSWKSIPISKIGKTYYSDTNDWIVGFDNLKIKDKRKQTLYIFVSVHGKVTGANYTGK